MNDDTKIPFTAFESVTTRLERMNKRLWILSLVLIALLFFTNFTWIIYEKQFETEKITVEQEVDTGDNGGDTVVNGVGDINYGESKTEGNND